MSNDSPESATPNPVSAEPQGKAPESEPGLGNSRAGVPKRVPIATQSGSNLAAWLTPATPPPLSEGIGTSLGSVAKQSTSALWPSTLPPEPAGQSPSGPYSSRLTRTGQRRPAAEDRQPTPEALRVRIWPDEVIGQAGYPATGFYVERYWGPIVGPTTLMLYRTVARRLEAEPDGFNVVTNKLANTVGCSARTGSASQFWRAVRRASRFGLLRQHDDQIVVRPAVGLLTSRMAQRLPQELRHEHRIWTGNLDHGADLKRSQTDPHHSNTSGPVARNSHDQGAALFALDFLRTAARGLCTPEELRILDNQRRLV